MPQAQTKIGRYRVVEQVEPWAVWAKPCRPRTSPHDPEALLRPPVVGVHSRSSSVLHR